MAVKFSEFTAKTSVTDVTEVVGYLQTGELNVRIPPANLDTTYVVSTGSAGASPTINLQGTKTGQTINPSVVSLSGGGSMLLNGNGTSTINFTSTAYDLTSTNAPVGSNSVPLVLTGTGGGDVGADTVTIIGTGSIKVSSAANVITIDGDGVDPAGPYLPLTAGSTKKLTNELYIQGTNGTGLESVLLRGVSSNDGDWLGSIRTKNTGGFNQQMRFYTSNADGIVNENLVLTLGADSNVGIGTDNPSEKLEVNGTIAFNSLKDTAENITITKFVDKADGLSNNNNDTSIPTSAAVIDYVTVTPGVSSYNVTGFAMNYLSRVNKDGGVVEGMEQVMKNTEKLILS